MRASLEHYFGWKIARFFFWLDKYKWSPANLGCRVCSWMERRHVYCERHGYKYKGE